MTSANSSRLDDAGSAPSSGSTTLHGRIEAIGIHDLLRVSTSKASTGRLLVFNDDSDAEVYYEQGRLVAVVTGTIFGRECLEQVLQMQHGEFEFAVGLRAPAERQTPNLHEVMLGSVREYYERQVRARQTLPGTNGEEPRSSGVHKIDGGDKSAAPVASSSPAAARTPSAPSAPSTSSTSSTPRASDPNAGAARSAPQSPAQASAPPSTAATARTGASNVTQAAAAPRSPFAQTASGLGTPPNKPQTSAAPKAAVAQSLAAGEVGNATIDAAGRVLLRNGTLTQHEAALAALALKLAARLGPSLGAREPIGVEIHAPGDKALICASAPDGIRISKITLDADIDAIWKRLKT